MKTKINPTELIALIEKILKLEFHERIKRFQVSPIIATIDNEKIFFMVVVESYYGNIDIFRYDINKTSATYSFKLIQRHTDYEKAKTIIRDMITKQRIDFYIVSSGFERTFHPDPEKPLRLEDLGYVRY